MKEYKQKKFPGILLCFTFILAMIATLNDAWNGGNSLTFAKTYTVVGVCFSVITIIVTVKDYKRNTVVINDEHLLLNKPKGLQPVEMKLNWNDIAVIRCYGKIRLTQEINICTRYKNIILRIASYKNYKEMLKTIIEKTENNENINIDKAVYDIII